MPTYNNKKKSIILTLIIACSLIQSEQAQAIPSLNGYAHNIGEATTKFWGTISPTLSRVGKKTKATLTNKRFLKKAAITGVCLFIARPFVSAGILVGGIIGGKPRAIGFGAALGSVDLSDQNNSVLMHLATLADQPDSINYLADRGANVNSQHAFFGDLMPLHVAALSGHIDAARTLFDRGALGNLRLPNGFMPIHLLLATAAQNHHPISVPMLRLLAERCPESLRAAVTPANLTPIKLAIGCELQEAVRILLEYDRDFAMEQDPRTRITSLHEAARIGDEILYQAMARSNPDHNVRDANGITPLMVAAREGKNGIVCTILKAGTPVDTADNGGLTALCYAARAGNLAAIDSILATGRAHIGAALHHALDAGQDEAALVLAQQRGTDINASLPLWANGTPETPLDIALRRQNRLAEKALRRTGAITNKFGEVGAAAAGSSASAMPDQPTGGETGTALAITFGLPDGDDPDQSAGSRRKSDNVD